MNEIKNKEKENPTNYFRKDNKNKKINENSFEIFKNISQQGKNF
jgi:hypothetical protein